MHGHRRLRFGWIALVLVLGTGVASAQYNVPAQATGRSESLVLASSGSDDQVIARGDAPLKLGYEMGASLDFLTRDRAAGAAEYKFTDVVFFRVHGLLAVGTKTELFGGVDLLPKQPSFTDELVWQGALVGVRRSLSDKYGLYLRGRGGPELDRQGYWAMGEAAAQAKIHLAERALYWDSTLGVTYTQLFPDQGRDLTWQTELLAETGIAIRDRRGFFAMWFNFTFHFPLAAMPPPGDPDPETGLVLDPQTRVGVALGALVGVTKSLDFFLETSILDRGDLQDPTTTLPILSGGFDQTRFLFGFNKRFGARRR
ncbi:MAG TPA: hypothetical protein VM513_32000 [Kofleriaceae bacterium]|nr:hypothetical protein [Kofleriaceae bacterium]